LEGGRYTHYKPPPTPPPSPNNGWKRSVRAEVRNYRKKKTGSVREAFGCRRALRALYGLPPPKKTMGGKKGTLELK